MTIPMMQGWWDESGKSLQSLAQTGMRVADPFFDNKLALAELVRQDPANQQKIIDMAAMNPAGIAQMYGPDVMQTIQGWGSPSSAAKTEMKARQLFETPISEVPGTVGARAATEALRVPSAAEARTEAATATRTETMAQAETEAFERTRKINQAQDPALFAQLEATNAAIQAVPDAVASDIEGLAQTIVAGGLKPELNQRLSALASVSPTNYKLLLDRIDALTNTQDREARQKFAWAQFNRQLQANDDATRRQALAAAREFQIETGVDVDIADLTKYMLGEETNPLVTAVIDRNVKLRQLKQRFVETSKLAPLYRSIASDDEQVRNASLMGFSSQLSTLAEGVVEAKETKGGFWESPENVYTIDGRPITGQELSALISDPTLAQAARELRGVLSNLSIVELDAIRKRINDKSELVTPDGTIVKLNASEKKFYDDAYKKELEFRGAVGNSSPRARGGRR